MPILGHGATYHGAVHLGRRGGAQGSTCVTNGWTPGLLGTYVKLSMRLGFPEILQFEEECTPGHAQLRKSLIRGGQGITIESSYPLEILPILRNMNFRNRFRVRLYVYLNGRMTGHYYRLNVLAFLMPDLLLLRLAMHLLGTTWALVLRLRRNHGHILFSYL